MVPGLRKGFVVLGLQDYSMLDWHHVAIAALHYERCSGSFASRLMSKLSCLQCHSQGTLTDPANIPTGSQRDFQANGTPRWWQVCRPSNPTKPAVAARNATKNFPSPGSSERDSQRHSSAAPSAAEVHAIIASIGHADSASLVSSRASQWVAWSGRCCGGKAVKHCKITSRAW